MTPLEGEVWKGTKHAGYSVSNFGKVVGRKGQVLRPRKHSNGYQRISAGFGNDAYVHILVLEAFEGERPSPLHEVDHINHDRADNRLENLRWIKIEDNRIRRRCTKLSPESVREIRALRIPRIEIARRFGISLSYVKQIRAREKWKSVA